MEETSGSRVCIYIPRARVRRLQYKAHKVAELVMSTHRLFFQGKVHLRLSEVVEAENDCIVHN